MTNQPRLVTEEVEQGILDAYKRGDPLLTIEKKYGVARPTVYWVLHKNGVAPQRAKQSRRAKATNVEAIELYRLIEAQDKTIQAMSLRIRTALAWAEDNAHEHYATLYELLEGTA
jgi:hypothetical protein